MTHPFQNFFESFFFIIFVISQEKERLLYNKLFLPFTLLWVLIEE